MNSGDALALAAPDGPLSTTLQDIVEEASETFNRPVAIDDRQMRLLAYTEHGPDEVDEIRMLSVMKRAFPPEVIAWLDRYGIYSTIDPVVVPGNPSLGLDTRVCAPIRCHGHLLGFLWLTDRDGSIAPEDRARAADFAEAAGLVLYREQLLRDADRSRERELLAGLLADDEDARREAAARLAELELFNASGPVVAFASPVPEASDGRSVDGARVAIDAAFARARRHLAPRNGLHLVRPDHALLVVAAGDPALRCDGVAAFATRLRDDLAGAFDDDPRHRYVVGIGGVSAEIADAADSCEQAVRATGVATRVEALGDIVSWDQLGVYKTLAGVPADALDPEVLLPGLCALIADKRTHFLVHTLECYLDHAGDIQRTSAALFLHRTSVYHRLRRLERLANVDLADGDDRLAVHLALKMARLRGLAWSVDER